MKARFGESEIPCPQIIIEAETEMERLLLRVFCSYHEYTKDPLKFQMQGGVKNCDLSGYTSCNIGWVPDMGKKEV